jgi:hypothetical protein
MLILEPFFSLKQYAGFSWRDYYFMPLTYKRWYMKRLNKEFKEQSDNNTVATSKAPAFNTPDMKMMTGKMPFSR